MNYIAYDDDYIGLEIPSLSRKKCQNWRSRVKGLLKAELKKRNLTYAELAARLASVGVRDTERNISNKVSRGSFTAVFFVQCMEAIGCRTIHLDSD